MKTHILGKYPICNWIYTYLNVAEKNIFFMNFTFCFAWTEFPSFIVLYNELVTYILKPDWYIVKNIQFKKLIISRTQQFEQLASS